MGTDDYWHVSPSVNRQSIERYGLDWRRMTTTGIALPPGEDPARSNRVRPELEAVFLSEAPEMAEFFVRFGIHPAVDVWKVDATGLVVEDAPDGWHLCRSPIGPSRVTLVHRDRRPQDVVETAKPPKTE